MIIPGITQMMKQQQMSNGRETMTDAALAEDSSGAKELLTPEEFEAAIRAVGAERYHNKHIFHKMLHGGQMNKGQVQAWALNRYCYQDAVPRKDAALMARTDDRELRREWI